jgi:hypothetical protein
MDGEIPGHLLYACFAHAVFDGVHIDRRFINAGIGRHAAIHAGEEHDTSLAPLGHRIPECTRERKGGREVAMIRTIKVLCGKIIKPLGRGCVGHDDHAIGHASSGYLILDKRGCGCGIVCIESRVHQLFMVQIRLIHVHRKHTSLHARKEIHDGLAEVARTAEHPDVPPSEVKNGGR